MKRRRTERMEKKTTESVPEYIKKRVHDLYWSGDVNCARTPLLILSELYEIPLEAQTLLAAAAFETHFGSLRCRELRPGGFTPQDPPHLCEKLSCESVEFIWNYIQKLES